MNKLSRLHLALGSASALESVALKATIVLPILLLQKPSKTFKNKEHILKRRLSLWSSGELMELVKKGEPYNRGCPGGVKVRQPSCLGPFPT